MNLRNITFEFKKSQNYIHNISLHKKLKIGLHGTTVKKSQEMVSQIVG